MRQAHAWMADHTHRLSLLRAILAVGIVSTGLHFTHNFVEVDQYPDDLVSGEVVRVAIIVAWPLLTLVGLLGYRLYAQGRYGPAHACLLSFSVLGLTTPAHFLDGNPEIPAFWYATIFTDGLAGLLMLGFVVWSARLARPGIPRPA